MRFRVRKAAHVLERSGLALAGAACGLFVGAYVGSTIAMLTTQGFLLLLMILGAIGFYLGIDTPQIPFHPHEEIEAGGSGGEIDAPEFLSAVGTFLATLTAFVSVGVIVLRETPHITWSWIVLIAWLAGVAMQVIGGAITRTRKSD
jgi:hypothetical protein